MSTYFTASEAAAEARLSTAYLAKVRVSGGGCAFYKPNARTILYRRDEFEAWINSKRQLSTSASLSEGGQRNV